MPAALTPTNFDLRDLLQSVVDQFSRAAAAKGLEIYCSLGSGIPTKLRGDAEKLRDALVRLADNSVKFTQAGRVSIGAFLESQTQSRAALRLEVSDTGIGIAPEEQGRLFKPFGHANPAIRRRYRGAGLGLAIGKATADLMGGQIGLESAPGAGSRFWLKLELEKQPLSETVAQEPSLIVEAIEAPEPPAPPPPQPVFEQKPPEPVKEAPAPQPAPAPEPEPVPEPEPAPDPAEPLVSETKAQGPAPAVDTRVAPLWRHRFRLLAVFSADSDRDIVSSSLQKLGYECDFAGNSQEAVLALSQRPYGMILMEFRSGYRAAVLGIRHNRGANFEIPIVAVMPDDSSLLKEGESIALTATSAFVRRPLGADLLWAVINRFDIPVSPASMEQIRQLGGQNLLNKALDSFLVEAPKALQNIRTSIDAGDSKTLEKAAHLMNGLGGHFGATGIRSIAVRLEALGAAGKAAETGELRGALEDEYLRVKLAAEKERGAGGKPAPAMPRGIKSRKALLCDDDRSLGGIIEFLLKKQGFEVFLAEDGQAGLDLIRRESPDLVMLDVNMPQKDGFAVLAELRGLRQPGTYDPYVVVVSNYESEDIRQKALAHGAQEMISKPINPQELVKKIVALLQS